MMSEAMAVLTMSFKKDIKNLHDLMAQITEKSLLISWPDLYFYSKRQSSNNQARRSIYLHGSLLKIYM